MDYPLLNVFFTLVWFFLWVVWLMLLFRVIVDIFRDDSLGGWAKAGWSIFVIILPLLGVFIYLVARGKGMGQREIAHALDREARFREAVESHAGRESRQSEEIARLADLRNHGDLTPEEFARAKQRILTG